MKVTYVMYQALLKALAEALDPIPESMAQCHRGICPQEECARCGRILRAHNALEQLGRATEIV